MADGRGVVVVGGGVMGLSCAWRLAEGGARVTILEARDFGGGATLAALGALWPASPLARGPLQELHRASLWEFEAFLGELTRRSGRHVGFHRLGRLELLNSDKASARAQEEARAACECWPRFGGDQPVMEALSPELIAQSWPALAPAPQGGLLCRATAQVDVPELVQALQAACAAAGVTLRPHTRVTALETTAAGIAAVRTADERINAGAVLVTAGAWSAGLSPEVGQVAPVRPVRGQGLALAMPAHVPIPMVFKSEIVYLIPWPERGEVLVGSTTEPEAGFDETPTEEGRATLLAGAAGILPALRGATVLRHWAGLRPQNPARRHPPIMGPHPPLPGLFLCTAHFKTGIGLAPRVSRLMAQAMGGNLPAELTPFLPRRA